MEILYLDNEQIVVLENRQRQEFDETALADLHDSIRDFGLLQPLSVRVNKESDKYILIAGERRLRSIRRLFDEGYAIRFSEQELRDKIPVICVGDVSALEAEEMELAENMKRKDLTWQEQASATKRLHLLRIAQAEERGEKHTISDTAEEITGSRTGGNRDKIKAEIMVADYLDDPDVAKAKNPRQALTILKKKELVAQAQKIAETTQPKKTNPHKLYNGDCLKIMSDLIDRGERFDVILTDPPYGINAHQFDNGAGNAVALEHHYKDTPTHFKELMTKFAPLSYAITKEEAHMYLFCDIEHYIWLRTLLTENGWYCHRTPLILYRMTGGRVPLPKIGVRRQYELILYAIKGDKATNGIAPDVVLGRMGQSTEPVLHGATKPVVVYENLLARSTRPMDKVLDCFCGSGTIFPACQAFQCLATGIELNSEYYALAKKRLLECETMEATLPNYDITKIQLN